MPFAGSPLTATKPRTAPGWQRACGLTASVTATAEPPRAKNSAAPAMTVDGLTRIGDLRVATTRASSRAGRTSRSGSVRDATGAVHDHVGAGDRVVALDVAVLRRHPALDPRLPGPPRRPGRRRGRAAPRTARRPRCGRRSRRGTCGGGRTRLRRRRVPGRDRAVAAGAARFPVPRGVSAASRPASSGSNTSARRRARSNPSPSQNSSVPTTCARGIRAARVDLPAPPRPPIPTKVNARTGSAASIRSSTGCASTVPR